MRLLLVTP
ncbi:hypothetical protein VC116059_000237A, partial [Vibrio cholerae O1 str. 116059]